MARLHPRRLVLVSVLLAPLAGAQQPLPDDSASTPRVPRLSGYFEHQFSIAETPSGWKQLDYDRLRVDVDASTGRGVRGSAGLVWQIFRGRTLVPLTDAVPANLRDQLPQGLEIEIADRDYLNHAYVALDAGAARLTVGKQYLTWGKGLVFNPTELFRPKVLFDPTYEREGVAAISAGLETGALSDVRIIYVPEGDWRMSGKLARVRGHRAGFDLSALVAEVWESDVVGLLLGNPGASARRRTVGGDVSGEILNLGVWVEGTWSTRSDTTWVEVTTGGNTTLPGNVLVSLEGYFDGRGRWSAPYTLTEWLALAGGARRTLGRTMLFASASRPASDVLTLAVSALANVGDRSAALLPSVAYAFAENVDLFVQAVVPLGRDGTEFGTRGGGALARGRLYF